MADTMAGKVGIFFKWFGVAMAALVLIVIVIAVIAPPSPTQEPIAKLNERDQVARNPTAEKEAIRASLAVAVAASDGCTSAVERAVDTMSGKNGRLEAKTLGFVLELAATHCRDSEEKFKAMKPPAISKELRDRWQGIVDNQCAAGNRQHADAFDAFILAANGRVDEKDISVLASETGEAYQMLGDCLSSIKALGARNGTPL